MTAEWCEVCTEQLAESHGMCAACLARSQWIERQVADAPPLTDEQRETIARLLTSES